MIDYRANIVWDKEPASFERMQYISNIICKENSRIYRNVLCKSTCGRDIEYFHIGSYINPAIYVGAFHGMEWITSLILLKFLSDIAFSMENKISICNINIYKFLNYKGLTIIPCINPDGVEITINGSKSANQYENLVQNISKGNTDNWQANAKGVDLNHNFDANWSELKRLEKKNNIVSPAATRFGGEFPESEVESHALCDFCRKNNFRHAIAFHSQGEEIYWNFGKHRAKYSKLIAQMLSESSGYKLSTPEKLATGGGFKDWFIQKLEKPAFTIEVGKGKNPLPLIDFYDIYNKILEMLLLGCII